MTAGRRSIVALKIARWASNSPWSGRMTRPAMVRSSSWSGSSSVTMPRSVRPGHRAAVAVATSASARLPPRDDPPGAVAQLLDHRPHRSRQVDAGRPSPRADPYDRRPADDEPGPRLDGPGAREGD